MVGLPGSVSVQGVVVALVGAVALGFGATVASSQIELAVIQGTVVDDAGRPLEGVTFRIFDVGRGRDFIVRSDKNGRFYRRGLPAVDYELTVEKQGYQPIHDKVKLSAGIDKRYDFKLVKAAPEGAEDFAKGVEAFSRGDNQAAARAFEETLKKAPELLEVRVNLALTYLRLSRTADAVAQLEKAAELGPDKPSVLFQLGEAYVEMKELDQAIAALEKGLAKQQDLSDPLALEATITLGAVYFAKGKNDEAIARFEKALAVRPDAAAPRLGLGKCYFSRGDLDKALDAFRRVVSTAPGTPEASEAERFIKALAKPQIPGACSLVGGRK